MDKLGLAAQMGLDVVMRQSLCGENYGLLEVGTFEPNPVSGWNIVVYKCSCLDSLE